MIFILDLTGFQNLSGLAMHRGTIEQLHCFLLMKFTVFDYITSHKNSLSE